MGDMAGRIIMCLVCFGCAVLFFAIGIYAQKREKPMWFWADTAVDASQITDIRQYNKENGILWKRYSLWFWAAGLAEFWNTLASVAVLVLGCTAGIALLIRGYNRIYKKYSVQ